MNDTEHAEPRRAALAEAYASMLAILRRDSDERQSEQKADPNESTTKE